METAVTRLSDLIRKEADAPDSSGRPLPQPGATPLDAERAWVLTARQEVCRIKDTVHSGRAPELKGSAQLAEQLIPLLHHRDELVRWALSGQTDDYLVDNAVRVAILATKMGFGLQYPEQEVQRLALAALLHDIGMWTIPSALVTKGGVLSEEERDIIRTHPERGRRILAAQGGVFEWVSIIVAQEHERWDGSGYPCRLKGKQIAEPAAVIGIVDTLEAMVTIRPYRKRSTPHQVVRELLLHAKATFSLRVLKALGDHITLYPVGTTVRLNSGEQGNVTRINARYPLRPVVTITKFGETSECDLSRGMSTHIVEVLQDLGPL